MARKSSAFVEGLQSGMELGTKIMKAREEQAMKKEFAALDVEAKPAKTFAVTGADGVEKTYADEKMAQAALKDAGENAKIDSKYAVGGKTFGTAEDAQHAAAQLNSPAAKLRQRSEIALKYNRPDIAEAYGQNYKRQMEANQAEIQHVFNQARLVGDTSAVETMYNSRLPNGVTAKIVPGEGGAVNVNLYKGETLYQSKPYASADALFEQLAPMAAATPQNMLEIWSRQEAQKNSDRDFKENVRGNDIRAAQTDRGLGLQERGVKVNEAKAKAEIDNIPIENALKSRQVGAAETGAQASLTSAGASATNAQTGAAGLDLERQKFTAPKLFSGVDEKGAVTMGATETPYDPTTKEYGLRIIKPQTVPGMLPTPRGTPKPPDPLAALLKPPKSDAEMLAEMQAAFQPKAPAAGGLPPAPVAPVAPAGKLQPRSLGGGIQTTFPRRN